MGEHIGSETQTIRPVAEMKRVLVVDDHPIARHGIRRLLEGTPYPVALTEASDGVAALEAARRDTPHLVILDLRLPTPRGTPALCQELLAVSPASRILICTAFDDADQIGECLAAGAWGCVLKDADEIDFASALERIESGETVIDPRIAQQLAVRFTRGIGHDDAANRLTNRERVVLGLLGDGLSNRQIARELYISEHTVKGYVTSLLRKLGAHSRLEAVVVATRAGLLVDRQRSSSLTWS